MFVIPDVSMAAILTAILLKIGTAVTGVCHVHLYTNNLTPNKNNVLGDFTELTTVEVPGYLAAVANWWAGVPYREVDGSWSSPDSVPDPSFSATGVVPSPTTVYGIFVTDSTNLILLASGIFTTPFVFNSLGDGFVLSGNPNLLQSDGSTLTLALPNLQPA